MAQSSAVATIEAKATENGVRLVGHALALTAGRYEARMQIRKSGRSGSTSTTQGGAFELKAGGSVEVATVGLSMEPGDNLSVSLVLSNDGRNVAESTLSVGQ